MEIPSLSQDPFFVTPKISVIIRTIGRPYVLHEALSSLENQTYKNFEIIVVEDGQEISKEFIITAFPQLNIRYYCTGVHVGRSKAGNVGLSHAKGNYLIFLDDDDAFFPDHLAVLVEALENANTKAAYSIAYEVPTETISTNPYVYKEKTQRVVFNYPFNRMRLLWRNYIPVQTILFHRDLYEQHGGFDENLELLEDWDLWIRYAMTTDFTYVPKITSKYRIPADVKSEKIRFKRFSNYLPVLREKQKDLVFTMNANRTAREMDEIINQFDRKFEHCFFYQSLHIYSLIKQYLSDILFRMK